MNDLFQWGREARKCRQGSAWRMQDRRYWTASWSALFDTHERDGQMRHDGKQWISQTGKFVSYPQAVTDDYGVLVPV